MLLSYIKTQETFSILHDTDTIESGTYSMDLLLIMLNKLFKGKSLDYITEVKANVNNKFNWFDLSVYIDF